MQKGNGGAEKCNTYDVGKSVVYELMKLEAEAGDIHPRTDACGRKAILGESEQLFLVLSKDYEICTVSVGTILIYIRCCAGVGELNTSSKPLVIK